MPLGDFITRETVVLDGGRRFVCRPPTLATVHRALSLYGDRVVAIVAAFRDAEVPPSAETVVPLFMKAGDIRAGMVLETCVDLVGGLPGELREAVTVSEALQDRLATEVLALCDAERIVKALHLTDVLGAGDVPEGRENDDVAGLAAVARWAGVSPLALQAWPYEAFLSAQDVAFRTEADPNRVGADPTLDDLKAAGFMVEERADG